MKPLSIIIPTTNRPELLEMALGSVARQTAADQIEEVIVSENTGNPASKKVCEKFPGLPIVYRQSDPPIEYASHHYTLYQSAKAEFIAMLHDDDWWASGHLHTALCALRNNPQAAGYFSASLFIESERAQIAHVENSPVIWVAAGKPHFSVPWILETKDVIAITWILTPFHQSGMVARKDTLNKELRALPGTNPWYADRITYPWLSRSGPLLYNPFVEVFIRRHAGNWHNDKTEEYLNTIHREGSRKIFQIAVECGIRTDELWRGYFDKMSEDARYEISNYATAVFGLELLRKMGLDILILKPQPRSCKAIAHHVVRQCLPPLLTKCIHKLISGLSANDRKKNDSYDQTHTR